MTFLPTRSGYFVGTPPRVRDIRVGGARDYQCIWFRTFGHSEFQFYYDLFYPARDRVASRRGRVARRIRGIKELLKILLTARALAYWFMDDGFYRTRKAKRYDFFSTHSFPLEDQ